MHSMHGEIEHFLMILRQVFQWNGLDMTLLEVLADDVIEPVEISL